LFFSDICRKLWQVRLLLVNYRRLYRLFGSGAMHSPYALFINQTKQFNHGRKIGLIRAAGTRMAGHTYAQLRMLRLREPLVATINSAAYINLKLKGFPKKVEAFISNPDMWDATFILQRCLFPMIRVLRLGDVAACGGMSKVVYFVHKTDEAIQKSMVLLKDMKYFADHQPADAEDEEGVDLEDNNFGDDDDSDAPDDEEVVHEEDEDEVDDDEELHLGEQILSIWKKRREKLITPLSIAGWFCSPIEDIRMDVITHAIGADRLDVESVIAKIYHPMGDDDLGRIIQTFWREFDDFQTKRGLSYSRAFIWKTDEIKEGKCHLWHKIYSVPFHPVFGKVACRVCSKPLGCGQAERNWGALKHLKTGKRSHLSGDKAERQATIFGAACIDRVRAKEHAADRSGNVSSGWTDADMELEMGLENWAGTTIGNVLSVAVPVVPKRLFKAWIEDWEWDCIHHKDAVAEARLLQKYGGMRWIDPDPNCSGGSRGMCISDAGNMEFQAGRNGAGWCLIGTNELDGEVEPWTIEIVIDLIADYEQPAEANVEIIIDEGLREANWERQLSNKKQRTNRKRK
jgi:hypothetical protein